MSQQQPGWQAPTTHQQQWGAPPPPPKKSNAGKIVGLGCAGIVGLVVLLGIFGAVIGNDSDSSTTSKPAASTPQEQKEEAPADDAKADEEQPSEKPKAEEAKKEEKPKVVFKVWGTAPAGALGPLDITYGSDSDNRKGTFKNGQFEASLTLDDDALYYTVHAQLQGSGDINCSVTIDGETKKGHASGGYNICNAQANAGLLGGWD